MTNITFMMGSIHIGTQAVIVFMNKRNDANETMLCLNGDVQRLVVSLFETILVDKIEQTHAILLYSDNLNH